MFSRVLIFGGTGSLGTMIIRMWLGKVEEFIVYSRSENNQWNLRQTFPDAKINFVLGDVTNKEKIRETIQKHDPTLIVVASAMKHIERCEENIRSCINTNVLGLLNITEVVDEFASHSSLQKLVMVSTDKACSPVNVYGMSKSICEHIVQTRTGIAPFVCVRYGNVINSNGSIIPLLFKQGNDGNTISFTLTDDRMTRFYMTLEDSVNLIEDCVMNGKNGEIWIPRLNSMKISDLMEFFSEKYKKPVKITGIRPGEKIHESLISVTESLRTETRGDRFVILPSTSGNLPGIMKEYSSADNILPKHDLIQKLQDYLEPEKTRKHTLIIFGSKGVLGKYIDTFFQNLPGYSVVCVNDRIQADTNLNLLPSYPLPVVVINCIGKTNKVNATPEEYKMINTDFPLKLNELCVQRKWRFIQPSTDCVFDGNISVNKVYTETDFPTPSDDYGKSKLAGECGTTIRLSMIGKEQGTRRGLYQKVCTSAKMDGYTNHYWNGVTCLEYAKIIKQIIEKNIWWTGSRHIAPNYTFTKYRLLTHIKTINKLKLEITPKTDTKTVNRKLGSIYSMNLAISDLDTQLEELKTFEIPSSQDLVLLVSCCNVDNSKPLHYSSVRSIYSNDERFIQSIETIKSVQKYLPGTDIWFVENSELTSNQLEKLMEYPVRFFDLSQDQNIKEQSLSPFKGPAELLTTRIVLIREEVKKYRRIFKLNARYLLDERFREEKFSSEKISLRIFPTGNVSTVFYCVPSCKIEEFVNDIDTVVKKTWNSPISIEAVVGKSLDPNSVQAVDELGIHGNVSVDGTIAYH